jgi:hypothetical protein
VHQALPLAALGGELQEPVDALDVAAGLEADAELHRVRGQVVGLADVEDLVGDVGVAVVAHVVEQPVEALGDEARQEARSEPEQEPREVTRPRAP